MITLYNKNIIINKINNNNLIEYILYIYYIINNIYSDHSIQWISTLMIIY